MILYMIYDEMEKVEMGFISNMHIVCEMGKENVYYLYVGNLFHSLVG